MVSMMQINEIELRYVLSELAPEDDEDWLFEEFMKILEQYRSEVLTTYNK